MKQFRDCLLEIVKWLEKENLTDRRVWYQKKHAKVELLTIEKFNLQNKDLPSKKIEDEHNEQRKLENKQLGSVEWKNTASSIIGYSNCRCMVDVTQVGTAPKLKKNKNIVWLIYYLCQLCSPTLLGKLALINLPYFAVQLQECVCPANRVTFMGL